jgi:hypothetical protein
MSLIDYIADAPITVIITIIIIIIIIIITSS